MASYSVGENQLQRIIRDLHDAVAELSKEHRETGEPVTDDSSSLHKFSYKLEYLLQFDQKEKTTFLGIRKDYWDYFCECLAKLKGANDGIRFVKSIPELKTSLGKGRAFIRYSLVHQRLADTLQQCLMNPKVTSEWYYARSPFLKSHLSIDIINHLYELNEIQFDVASRGHDLDSEWPTFARRTLGTGVSSSHLWRPPSRCSSINSLVSSYSQQPAEFLPGPDFSPCQLGELSELGHPSSCSAADDLRVELDQSELRQRDLLERVRLLTKEAGDLRAVIRNLETQLSGTVSTGQKRQQQQCGASIISGQQEVAQNQQAEEAKANGEIANHLQADVPSEEIGVREASESDLQAKLNLSEKRNMELLAKLDGALTEKSQHAANYCDSAWKIQELLAKLKEAEAERLAARGRSEELGERAERLAQELRLREQSLRESGERLTAAEEERAGSVRQAEELRAAVGRLQGALSLKERETGNLRTQLHDLQGALERQAEELRKISAVQDDREALQQKNQSLKEEQVKGRDGQVETSNMGANKKDPTAKKVEDYKAQCTTLMELNAKLLQTVKRNEESTRELAQARQVAERELAILRTSEAQLRTRLEASQLPLEERERRLLEENRALEESAQQALARAEEAEKEARRLERELGERRDTETEGAKEQPAPAQEELSLLRARASELEQSLATSEEKQQELQRQLEEARRSRSRGSEEGEAAGAGQAVSRLALAEAQRELQTREVLRLQEEATGLRAQLQQSTEERLKTQALQEVTEASREDLRVQAQQLKAQVEELNRRHVEELLRGREREETLAGERDREGRERAALAAEAATLREEHGALKRRLDALAVENAEAREALHRANTETAELGVHVCALTGQNEDARRRWEALSERLSQMEKEAAAEVCALNGSLDTLRQENSRLQEELRQAQALPGCLQEAQGVREENQTGPRSQQEDSQREIQDLKLQLSKSATEHEAKLQGITEELVSVRFQLENTQQQVSTLETKLKEAETFNQNSSHLLEERNGRIANTQTALHQKEEEVRKLKGDLSKAEEQLALAQKACQDLSESLRRTTTEKQTSDLKTSAEIDDLYRTKRNLEERLIELIRDKDALWQKSDALEFEQKLREEQTDREQSHCLGCHSQFSWWLRKHNCRLCGRAFCYYCCSNTVSTLQGGTRERCCKDCYTQHSAVVERHPQEDLGTPPYPPFNPLAPPSSSVPSVRVAEQSPRPPDDGVFDIITEEEVNCIYDSDSLSYTTACSPERRRQGADELNSTTSASDVTTEESEEIIAAVQDAELCLLKSGELTLSVPFGVDEISQFGDEFRELFVKSSCYSIIPIAVVDAGPTISWVFSSEPKSISFSMVYRDNTDIPLEQAKVMIPLTRCNSHKETIQGQLKVRNPGEYTLIFDNSFSRFISKKVLYRLSVEKPVVYDGSDCP